MKKKKSYKLYWYDKAMDCTNSTVFEGKNDKVAINIANHMIEYYDMKNPQLYEIKEDDSWYSRRVALDEQ